MTIIDYGYDNSLKENNGRLKQINILRNTPGQKNWQPNYHDHIVRDDASYQRIKNFINKNNPRNCKGDTFNAKNKEGAA